MKTLIFEGAGWNGSESCGDVGNCRIRTTFLDDAGDEIYLEMNGIKTHKWVLEKMKQFNIAGYVAHCFSKNKLIDRDLRAFEHAEYFEWSKENILKFVNEKLGCSFDAIEVRGDWDGFSVDGGYE